MSGGFLLIKSPLLVYCPPAKMAAKFALVFITLKTLMGTGDVELALGESHSLLLKQDSSVWSCGLNSDGQLGNDSSIHHSEHFVQAISSGVKCVAAGLSHSIALKQDDTVWATGKNSYGQLGDGTTTDKDHFSFVQLFRGAKAVVAGGWHSMVLTSVGAVWTAGWNKFGQLGDEEISNTTFSPLWQQTAEEAEAVAAGHLHSLVLKKDGTIWAAGRNGYGQLGDGSKIDRRSFVQAVDSEGKAVTAVAVAAGGYHSLALTQDKRVLATGWNRYGQLGDRRLTTGDRATFEPVFYGAKAIAAGTRHSIVLTLDGSVWTTGYNQHGQLGDRSTNTKTTLLQVIPDGVEAVAAGGHHSMVLKQDGSVWATGSNEYGQIGDGSTTTMKSFVRVAQICDGALGHSVFAEVEIPPYVCPQKHVSTPKTMPSVDTRLVDRTATIDGAIVLR